MGKSANLLDSATIKAAIAKGTDQILNDGASLSLKIRGGSALWVYKFRDGVSFRSTSLGSYHHGMGLTAARNERNAFAARRYVQRIPRRGLSVIQSAPPATEPPAGDSASNGFKLRPVLFADLVDSFITLMSSEWKVKSREPAHYRRLKTGALGKLWAHEINHRDVETELRTRWCNALANAAKMRGRISLVMDHAVAKDARDPDSSNPARKEVIGKLIPKPPKSTPRARMKHDEVPAFVAELVADGSPAARALAFAILTVGRNAEARLADWSEIEDAAWIIPGGRDERSMKEGLEHVVPLSQQALSLLGKRKASGLVFGALSNHALIDRLHASRENLTVHGFRTSFTDWARAAKYPKDLRELAKAHAAGQDAYERYTREEQLDVLRPMLDAWAKFCMRMSGAAS